MDTWTHICVTLAIVLLAGFLVTSIIVHVLDREHLRMTHAPVRTRIKHTLFYLAYIVAIPMLIIPPTYFLLEPVTFLQSKELLSQFLFVPAIAAFSGLIVHNINKARKTVKELKALYKARRSA